MEKSKIEIVSLYFRQSQNPHKIHSETITIKVKDQGGDEMFFKVKKTTKMSKIFDAYSQRRGIASTSIRFVYDGQRVQPETTPKMLEMDDNDQIDVFLEAVGGQ